MAHNYCGRNIGWGFYAGILLVCILEQWPWLHSWLSKVSKRTLYVIAVTACAVELKHQLISVEGSTVGFFIQSERVLSSVSDKIITGFFAKDRGGPYSRGTMLVIWRSGPCSTRSFEVAAHELGRWIKCGLILVYEIHSYGSMSTDVR